MSVPIFDLTEEEYARVVNKIYRDIFAGMCMCKKVYTSNEDLKEVEITSEDINYEWENDKRLQTLTTTIYNHVMECWKVIEE